MTNVPLYDFSSKEGFKNCLEENAHEIIDYLTGKNLQPIIKDLDLVLGDSLPISRAEEIVCLLFMELYQPHTAFQKHLISMNRHYLKTNPQIEESVNTCLEFYRKHQNNLHLFDKTEYNQYFDTLKEQKILQQNHETRTYSFNGLDALEKIMDNVPFDEDDIYERFDFYYPDFLKPVETNKQTVIREILESYFRKDKMISLVEETSYTDDGLAQFEVDISKFYINDKVRKSNISDYTADDLVYLPESKDIILIFSDYSQHYLNLNLKNSILIDPCVTATQDEVIINALGDTLYCGRVTKDGYTIPCKISDGTITSITHDSTGKLITNTEKIRISEDGLTCHYNQRGEKHSHTIQ